MFRLKSLPSIAKVRTAPGLLAVSSLIFMLGWVAPASAQNFTLSATPFNPYAVNQSYSTNSTVTLSPLNGFSGSVSLGCTVTGGSPTSEPICQISPALVTPPATASLTFSAVVAGSSPQQNATPGSYVVTVTGTGSGSSAQQSLNVSVLAIAPSYTVIVTRPAQPTSVHAGSLSTATININSVNGYLLSGQDSNGNPLGVWLSCATVSPLVTYSPPQCSFSPQPAPVTTAVTVVKMTITTLGNAQNGLNAAPINAAPSRQFYALWLWLPLPMLAIVGIGAASNKRSRKAWGLLGLFVLTATFLLMPGCGNTTTGTTAPTPEYPTPKNSYTFTLRGVDSNGVISTNTGTVSSAPSVKLTVN